MASNRQDAAVDSVASLPPTLTYVSNEGPGITRKRTGTGFSYRLPDGGLLEDRAAIERIRSLVIPPAWTDVWICLEAKGHLQATGRDAKGRKQYKYHPQWREVRDRDKYEHILDFARMLPRLRARVEEDMSRRGLPREKVLATAVGLLDKALIRVGNDEYAKQNGSYGLTTLRTRHLEINGSELRFHFKGKSGKTWRLQVKDRRIARVVRSIQDLPGQNLFQYIDESGEARTVASSDVNDYLRAIASRDVTTKDFRTWAGTVLAAMALSALGPFTGEAQAKANVRRAIEAVAARLGNTPAICRKCYVHPQIVASYMEAKLPPIQSGRGFHPRSGLPREEHAVLALLKRRMSSKPVRSAGARPKVRQPNTK